MAKKNLTLEEKLEAAIVKEGPYEVPGNWAWSRLGEVCEKVQYGYTEKASIEKVGPQFLRITDIQENGVNWGLVPYCPISEKDYDKYKLDKGDIVIARTGATTGKNYIINDEIDSVFASYLIRMKINKRIYNKFVSYYMYSDLYWKQIMEEQKGIAQPGVNAQKLGALIFPIPPLEEQQRIVDRIESFFEKLDKAKELIEEAREGFGKRKSAVLEKAFRGELTEKWRLLNGLGKGKMKKIKDISELISGQHISSSDYNTDGDGTPYLTGPADFGEISPIITKWTEKPKVIAMKNDILITVKGSGVGKVNILDRDNVCISRQLMAIRSSSVSFEYIFWYLKSQFAQLQALSTGTAIPGLSRGDILNLEIYCADTGEETEIVRILGKLLEEESKIEELTQLEEQIELIKKSILAKAFRGELGTNCEEDESAFELLKEILSKDI
ncbi:restriction endonuclease subunit S [Clostridium beijerinckii]|uniref:restriction endonuclease subunit S n=1 Tax=Clostridium beijerinckii TaxID=1520 RepID=UPI002430EC16|nr:restriction endonuclease subunit S [Clostridium beijerinckii]MDG5853128.1 restriction endonuclease subunit S [Clostridium beijerinckii]